MTFSHNSTLRHEPDGTITKCCGQCKSRLPAEKFGKDRTRASHGLQNWCLACKKAHGKIYYATHTEHYAQLRRTSKRKAVNNLWNRKRRALRRDAMFEHYGKRCECCGESNRAFLTLDHPNGDGAEHRRQHGGQEKVLIWLERNDWPDGYRILCFNCNCASHIYGTCPHTLESTLHLVGACG